MRAEVRAVTITELRRGGWEVTGPELRWERYLRGDGRTVRTGSVSRTYGSAAEARRAVEEHDTRFAQESGRSAVSAITWRPRTPLGRLWVSNLG